jgi:acyl-CoA reductase-like NAD-dependent aldehyde dehydrogenase
MSRRNLNALLAEKLSEIKDILLVRCFGLILEPTIYRDVPDTSRLVREEIFGPILVI